jgi:hypothetical protein
MAKARENPRQIKLKSQFAYGAKMSARMAAVFSQHSIQSKWAMTEIR